MFMDCTNCFLCLKTIYEWENRVTSDTGCRFLNFPPGEESHISCFSDECLRQVKDNKDFPYAKCVKCKSLVVKILASRSGPEYFHRACFASDQLNMCLRDPKIQKKVEEI